MLLLFLPSDNARQTVLNRGHTNTATDKYKRLDVVLSTREIVSVPGKRSSKFSVPLTYEFHAARVQSGQDGARHTVDQVLAERFELSAGDLGLEINVFMETFDGGICLGVGTQDLLDPVGFFSQTGHGAFRLTNVARGGLFHKLVCQQVLETHIKFVATQGPIKADRVNLELRHSALRLAFLDLHVGKGDQGRDGRTGAHVVEDVVFRLAREFAVDGIVEGHCYNNQKPKKCIFSM